MRILLTGDPNSPFVRQYALRLKLAYKGPLRVDLLPLHPTSEVIPSGIFSRVFKYPAIPLIRHRTKPAYLIRIFFVAWILYSRRQSYDAIHVHYLMQDLRFMPRLFRRFAPQRIITVWGSDFMLVSNGIRRHLKPVVEAATMVTFANPGTLDKFRNFYMPQNTPLLIRRYGLDPLDELRNLDQTDKSQCRRMAGLPEEALIVTVGYNFDSIQQHQAILQSILNTPGLERYRQNLLFLFPFTYGTEPDNRRLITELLRNFPFKYLIIERYLDLRGIALLRKSSDIMIQMQISDQLSGSMQEYLYAGNVVITGKWLDYRSLTDNMIYFKTVGRVEEAGEGLLGCIGNLPEEQSRCLINRQAIYALSSWESVIDSWIQLYISP